MKTRFDDEKVWFASERSYEIKKMETSHLINTLKMFVEKPFRTMTMVVSDIENYDVFTGKHYRDVKAESLYNITSMSEEDLILYALNSPLGLAMANELIERGVNLDNVMKLMIVFDDQTESETDGSGKEL